jgi:hypothetical protein
MSDDSTHPDDSSADDSVISPDLYLKVADVSHNDPMPPVFSKIPVAHLPHMTIVSGLRCIHGGCDALFVNREDSGEHAASVHAGKVAAVTCAIYEHRLKSGGVRLHRVLEEEDGE